MTDQTRATYGRTPAGADLRIGDAERERAASALGEHFASGRLTREEYDERSERVWAARTNTDLRPLFADLPPPGVAQPRPTRPGVPGRGWRVFPLVPVMVLLGLVTFAVLVGAPWLLFVFGWLFFCGPFHRGWAANLGQSRGSERAARGSWA